MLFYSQKFGKFKTHSGRLGFLNQKYNCLLCVLDTQALEQQVVKQKVSSREVDVPYTEKIHVVGNELWIFKGTENHLRLRDQSLKLFCPALQIFEFFFAL